MNVLVSCGWITALPSTALRAASTSASGEASLRRYPDTPAWIASEIAPRDSSIVIRMIFVSGEASRIRRVASMPSIPGIRTSMNTTSGVRSRACSTASSPLPASPTTTTASSESSSAVRSPSRVTGWSSTMSARIGTSGLLERKGRYRWGKHSAEISAPVEWPTRTNDEGRSDPTDEHEGATPTPAVAVESSGGRSPTTVCSRP